MGVGLKYFVLLAWLSLLCAAVPAREIRFISVETSPWASIDSRSGRAVGAFPDMVEELQRRTGHAMKISLQPFARIENELESGRQDCTIILWNEPRARLVEKGEAVYFHEMGVIARRGIRLRSYEDLRPLSISVLRGLSFDSRFDSDKLIRKEFDANYMIGVRKLAHRRVDAVAGAIQTLKQLAKEEGLEDYLGESLLLGQIELVLQCAKTSPNLDVMPELNRAIRGMRADGTLERIVRKNNYY